MLSRPNASCLLDYCISKGFINVNETTIIYRIYKNNWSIKEKKVILTPESYLRHWSLYYTIGRCLSFPRLFPSHLKGL